MTFTYEGNGLYFCVAADSKPTTGIATNALAFETDTALWYTFNGSSWLTGAGGITASSSDTLANKNINLTNNTVTDTSAAAGDIAAVAAGATKFTRMAKGSAYQVLRVKKDTSALEYNDPSTFPSSGRLYGIRQGFNGGMVNTTGGVGMLNGITAGNGTGATVSLGVDTTDGPRVNNSTGTNNTFARAGYWSSCPVARKYNPTYTVRFRLNAAQTSSNAMLYIGLINVATQPVSTASMTSTLLDTKIGVLFGFRAANTTWHIMSNNAQTNAVYTSLTSLPSSGATDNVAHTVSFTLDDATPKISWSFDGVAQTDITDATNQVPPSTTLLYPIMMLEAQTATSLTLYERWSQISMDAP